MYGHLYDKFADWLELAVDRAWYASMAWLNTLMIPELARLRDRRDRVLIVMVTGLEHPPTRGQRWMKFLAMIVIFPLLGMYAGYCLASLVLPMGRYLLLKMFIAYITGMLAFFLFGLGAQLLTLNRTRHAVYRALANLDESICPWCGYDLTGHLREAIEHDVRCPECGEMAPRLMPLDESHDESPDQ